MAAATFKLTVLGNVAHPLKGVRGALKLAQAAANAVVTKLGKPPRLAKHKVHALGLRLSDNLTMQATNKSFRKKDYATNVLSFPTDDADAYDADAKLVYIGDILIASDVVVAEAKAQGKRPADHFTHLVVHGILHLYGHDHMNPAEAARMEKLEIAILATLGIANPYVLES